IVHVAHLIKYDCWSAHLYSSKVSKATGAATIAARMDVPASRVIAIGDHLNDIELLQWAGLGIAMGDGHPETQAAANHVTGSLADDGVVQAVERFLLR